RYRFSGTPQFWGEGGLGTGHLISLQTESAFEHAPLRGHAGFCARLAAGLRWPVGQNMLLGGELAWLRRSNVEHAESGPFGIAQTRPIRSGSQERSLPRFRREEAPGMR